jgi:hypothetical protein
MAENVGDLGIDLRIGWSGSRKAFGLKSEKSLVYESLQCLIEVLRTRRIDRRVWLQGELPPQVRKCY